MSQDLEAGASPDLSGHAAKVVITRKRPILRDRFGYYRLFVDGVDAGRRLHIGRDEVFLIPPGKHSLSIGALKRSQSNVIEAHLEAGETRKFSCKTNGNLLSGLLDAPLARSGAKSWILLEED